MSLIPGIQSQPSELIDGVKVNSISELTTGNGTQMQGRTNGTPIEAGKVGEVITATLSNIVLTSGVPKTVGTITLTKGIWIAYGNPYVDAATAVTNYRCCISTTTDTLYGPGMLAIYGTTGTDYCVSAPSRVFNVSTDTNIFLVAAISGTGAINFRGATLSSFFAIRIA